MTTARFHVVTPRHPIAICETCGASHDPYDTGEWGICDECLPGAVDRAMATAGAR